MLLTASTEHLLKGSLLIALISVLSRVPAEGGCSSVCDSILTLRLRSGQALLFKWFLDLNVIDPAFDATAFTHNKERLLGHDVARRFFQRVLEEAKGRKLLSPNHFTVGGIPIVSGLEAWASISDRSRLSTTPE